MFIVRCIQKYIQAPSERHARWLSEGCYRFFVDRRFSSCRSYGAWTDKGAQGFYTHGAPKGA